MYAYFVSIGLISVVSPPADAYTLSCPDMRSTRYLAPGIPLEDQCKRKKKYGEKTYNLGLGKNLPVQSTTRIDQNHKPVDTMKCSLPQPIHRIAQFIVEHEATRPYPSPRESLQRTMGEMVFSGISCEDILCIEILNQAGENHPPVAVATTRDTMNLNTPWVEMMIHEQRQRSL